MLLIEEATYATIRSRMIYCMVWDWDGNGHLWWRSVDSGHE